MGWACSEYGERRGVYRVLVGKGEERNHLGDPGVDSRKNKGGSSGSGMWRNELYRAGSE
jgi:hypothetical protein